MTEALESLEQSGKIAEFPGRRWLEILHDRGAGLTPLGVAEAQKFDIRRKERK